MALYRKKGSKIVYTKFDFRGREIRRSTGVTNKKDARTVEAKIRTELAEGRWGILDERPAEVTLGEFLKKHFITGEIATKTREYYQYGIEKLLDSDLAKLPLNKITKQDGQRYVAKFVRPAGDYKLDQRREHLSNNKFSPSTVNCVLRTLRRALTVAHESRMLGTVPKIELAKNERKRDTVLSPSQQQTYFAVCDQPCNDVAMLLLDSGMRPEEIHVLRWENTEFTVTPCSNPLRLGTIHILVGKTKHAPRELSMTPDVYQVPRRWYEEQGRPKEGCVFPADTQSGHITESESSIRKQHYKAIGEAKLEHFEIYCFRHTFLTILGASGCDPYTLARIAGHADIQMTMRYCHTQQEFIETAFDRLVDFRQGRQKGVTTGGYWQNTEVHSNALAATANSSKNEPYLKAPVAQLDRASDYESEGRKFESCRAHQNQ